MKGPVCKHCGKPIEYYGRTGGITHWKHEDGYYGCNGSRPRDPVTYAEPKAESL